MQEVLKTGQIFSETKTKIIPHHCQPCLSRSNNIALSNTQRSIQADRYPQALDNFSVWWEQEFLNEGSESKKTGKNTY